MFPLLWSGAFIDPIHFTNFDFENRALYDVILLYDRYFLMVEKYYQDRIIVIAVFIFTSYFIFGDKKKVEAI